jgi:hypothetical protein
MTSFLNTILSADMNHQFTSLIQTVIVVDSHVKES